MPLTPSSNPDEMNEQMQMAVDLQFEMMGDMYNRMLVTCHKKCIATKYRDSDLTKGESVCIDRCVGKFLDIYEHIGTKLNTMTAQEEAKLQQQNVAAAAGSN